MGLCSVLCGSLNGREFRGEWIHYTCVCVYTYMCVCVYICVCIHIYVCVCMCVCMEIYIYVYIDESLHCPPETITTLAIPQYKIKSLKK